MNFYEEASTDQYMTYRESAMRVRFDHLDPARGNHLKMYCYQKGATREVSLQIRIRFFDFGQFYPVLTFAQSENLVQKIQTRTCSQTCFYTAKWTFSLFALNHCFSLQCVTQHTKHSESLTSTVLERAREYGGDA
jgi:hypothetical protein